MKITLLKRTRLPDTTRRAMRLLRTMQRKGELTPGACSALRGALLAGRDAYPYYSHMARRPFVWCEGHRYTAQEYNAHIEQIGAQQAQGITGEGIEAQEGAPC